MLRFSPHSLRSCRFRHAKYMKSKILYSPTSRRLDDRQSPNPSPARPASPKQSSVRTPRLKHAITHSTNVKNYSRSFKEKFTNESYVVNVKFPGSLVLELSGKALVKVKSQEVSREIKFLLILPTTHDRDSCICS